MMTSTALQLHVLPRAGRTEIVGWHGDAVKIKLKAPPVDGAANQELIRFLAKQIGVPRSSVRIASGITGRRKRVAVEGVSQDELLAALGINQK